MTERDYNMQEITVKEICQSFGYNLTSLAIKVGCSISLLSKVQNAKENISDNLQEKFQKVFPEFKLVNGTYKYKDLYEEALEDLKEASSEISRLEEELLVANLKLENIQTILNGGKQE